MKGRILYGKEQTEILDGCGATARHMDPVGGSVRPSVSGEGGTGPAAYEEWQAFTALNRKRALASDHTRQVATVGETAGYYEYVRWCGRTGAARPPPTRLSLHPHQPEGPQHVVELQMQLPFGESTPLRWANPPGPSTKLGAAGSSVVCANAAFGL